MPASEAAGGASTRARLSAGGLLARNTLFTAAGQGATLVVAFLAVPLLVDELGTARFGVLTLAWVVVGYASVFDLGVGRALTKLSSEKLGAGREQELAPLFWTALAVMLLMGALTGSIMAGLSPWLVNSVLSVPERLEEETLHSFFVLAATLPLAISGAAIRGHLEARQRFDLVNAVVIPMSAVTYFGPVVVLQFSNSLVAVVAAVGASRLVIWSLQMAMALRVTPALRARLDVRRRALVPLLRFGSWITVANVVNALMVTLDRFLVGAFISLTAVAYFATPYEVVTKLWLVTVALGAVLFPAFALNLGREPARAARLFSGGIRVGFMVLFPLTLAIVTFAHEGLDAWLGAEFATNSERVLQWLAVGVLLSSLAQIANGLVQSARPDLSAKLALIELPLYLGGFVAMLEAYGVDGAAAAWALRAAAEVVVLFLMVRRVSPLEPGLIARAAAAGAAALLTLLAASQLSDATAKGAFIASALAAFGALAWFGMLRPAERTMVRERLRAAGG